MRPNDQVLYELMKRLQVDASIRVDLSDLIGRMKTNDTAEEFLRIENGADDDDPAA